MIFFILEADILKLHIAPNLCQINRICRVLQIGRHLQNIHKPVKSGNAFLIEPAKIDQFLDWIDEDTDK